MGRDSYKMNNKSVNLSKSQTKRFEKKKRKKSGIRRSTLLRCLVPSSSGVELVRMLDIPLHVAYYIILLKVQWENLPEGPPYFNPLTETERKFSIYEPQPSWEVTWDGNRRPENLRSITLQIIPGVPIGVWFQLTMVIRVMLSCFVGYYENEELIIDRTRVLPDVTRNMWKPLLLAFPYQVLLPILHALFGQWIGDLICYFFNYIGVFRAFFIVRDAVFLKLYLGKHFNVVVIMIWGFILEQAYASFWLALPFIYCGNNYFKLPDEKFRVIDCVNDKCSLIRLNLGECLKRTWFIHLVKNLPVVPIVFNTINSSTSPRPGTGAFPLPSLRFASFCRTSISLMPMLSQHFVFIATRQIGSDEVLPRNYLELWILNLTMLLGTFGYTLHIAAIYSTYYLTKHHPLAEFSRQMEIVNTYCQLKNVDEERASLIKKFCSLKYFWHLDLLDKDMFKRLPNPYMDLIIEETSMKTLSQLRIFRDVDSKVLKIIAKICHSELYTKGYPIARPNTNLAGLMMIRRGYVAAIGLDGQNSSMVILGENDVFGEITVVYDLQSPILFVAITDCEIWVLSHEKFRKIAQKLSKKNQKIILSNHHAIVHTSTCFFHNENLPTTSPQLLLALKKFEKGPSQTFPVDYLQLEIPEKGKKKTCSCDQNMWHTDRKEVHQLNITLSVLALIGFPVFLFNYHPLNWFEIIVEVIPMRQEKSWLPILADEVFGIPLVMVFTADFLIWISLGIHTPYGVVTGRKACRYKLMMEQGGYVTIIRFITIFKPAFKFLRLVFYVQNFLSWRLQSFIMVIGYLMVIFTAAHYSARTGFGIAAMVWRSSDSLCSTIAAASNRLFNDTVCADAFPGWRANFKENLSTLSTAVELRGEVIGRGVEENYVDYMTTALAMTNSNRRLCKEYLSLFNYEFYIFQFFKMIDSMLTIGLCKRTFEIIDDGIHYVSLIGIQFAILLTCTLSGRLSADTARNSHSFIRLTSQIDSMIKTLNFYHVSPLLKKVLYDYVIHIKVTTNCVYLPEEARLLEKTPKAIKKMSVVPERFDLSYWTMGMLEMEILISRASYGARTLHFPPGVFLSCADSYTSCVYKIIRGQCAVVDVTGVTEFINAGGQVPRLPLCEVLQLSTVISLTNVEAKVINHNRLEKIISENSRILSCWQKSFVRIAPAIEYALEEVQASRLPHKAFKGKVNRIVRRTQTLKPGFHGASTKGWKWIEKIFLLHTFYVIKPGIDIYLTLSLIGYFLSAYFATLQSGIMINQTWMWCLNAVLDGYIACDTYLIAHLSFYSPSGKFVKDPPELIKYWKKHLFWVILSRFPWEVILYPFNISLSIIFSVRCTRLFRIFEVFRRAHFLCKGNPFVINKIIFFVILIGAIMHIHLLAILLFHMECKPVALKTYWKCSNPDWFLMFPEKRLNHLQFVKDLPVRFLTTISTSPEMNKIQWDRITKRYIGIGPTILKSGEALTHLFISTEFVDFFSYYITYIYLSLQWFTGLGLGEISQKSVNDVVISSIIYFFSVLHKLYTSTTIVGLWISFDPEEWTAIEQIKNQKSCLKSYHLRKNLAQRVTYYGETILANKRNNIAERENIPESLFMEIKYHMFEEWFQKFHLAKFLDRADLKVLAECMDIRITPRGDNLYKDFDLVDEVVLLVEGSLMISNLKKFKLAPRSSQKFENRRMSTPIMANFIFWPGSWFGTKNLNPVTLDIWRGTLIARQQCTFLLLPKNQLNLLQWRLGISSAPIFNFLRIQVRISARKSRNLWMLLGSGTEFDKNVGCYRRFVTERRIFDPTHTGIGVFLTLTAMIKVVVWLATHMLVISLGFSRKKGVRFTATDYTDATYYTFLCLLYFLLFVEIFVRIHSGYFDQTSKQVVMEPLEVWRHYVHSFRYLPLTILLMIPTPFIVREVETALPWPPRDPRNVAVLCLCLLNLHGHLVLAVQQFQDNVMMTFNQSLLAMKTFIRVACVGSVLLIVASMIWLHVGCFSFDLNQCTYGTWIRVGKDYEYSESFAQLFAVSFFFCLSSATFTGYGEVTPVTMIERFLFICFIITFFFCWIYIQALITNVIFGLTAVEAEFNRKMEDVKQVLHVNQCSAKTIDKITRYMRFFHANFDGRSLQTVFRSLPFSLRQEVHHAVAGPFLRRLSCLRPLPPWFRRRLALLVREEFHLPGDVILSEWETVAKCLYVYKGEVDLVGRKKGTVEMARDGTILCEEFLIEPGLIKFSVVALKVTQCLVLDSESFKSLVDEVVAMLDQRQILDDDDDDEDFEEEMKRLVRKTRSRKTVQFENVERTSTTTTMAN